MSKKKKKKKKKKFKKHHFVHQVRLTGSEQISRTQEPKSSEILGFKEVKKEPQPSSNTRTVWRSPTYINADLKRIAILSIVLVILLVILFYLSNSSSLFKPILDWIKV